MGQHVEEVKRLFQRLCQGNGEAELELGPEEFHRHIADVGVQACFARLGMNIDEQAYLFEMLDLDGNGKVSMDEFSEGIQLFNVNAMRIDVLRLSRENQGLFKIVEGLSKESEQLLALLEDQRVGKDWQGHAPNDSAAEDCET